MSLRAVGPFSRLLVVAPWLAIAAPVSADTITQVVPFDYDGNFGATLPVVQGFDTQAGTRQLTAVTFDMQHNFDLQFYFESTGPTPLAAGDFGLEFAYVMLYQLGEAPKKEGEPSPPLIGPGAFTASSVTTALGAYDGVPGNDGPDSARIDISDSFRTFETYGLNDPDVLGAMTRVGSFATVLGGFSELFFGWNNDPNWPIPPSGVPEYPTDAALWVSTPTFRHSGTLTITYDFVVVPEPASVMLLGGLALVSRRRR